MAKRALAILSEGRLSESQRKTLTLLSLGWLELIYVPEEEEEERHSGGGYTVSKKIDREKELWDLLKKEDEEVFAIIRTFIQWEN